MKRDKVSTLWLLLCGVALGAGTHIIFEKYTIVVIVLAIVCAAVYESKHDRKS